MQYLNTYPTVGGKGVNRVGFPNRLCCFFLGLLGIIGFSTTAVNAQLTPNGTETLVNTTTAETQERPVLAMDSTGNFVVVWESYAQDGSDFGIYAQRYNANLTTNGSEFKINTTTAHGQRLPDVAMDANGNFAVVYMSDGTDGDQYGIYRRRYSSAGAVVGSETRLNSTTTGNQKQPRIAMDEDGDYVVVWQAEGEDGDDFGIIARRYNSAGATLTAEILINTTTVSYQGHPAIDMSPSGAYVIAWQTVINDTNRVVFQRFDASGNAQGSETVANTSLSENRQEPSVAMDANGEFVITWASYGQDTDNQGIFAQRFDASGNKQGSEFQVNTTTAGSQDHPDVAMTAEGGFVITWSSYGQDGSFHGVYLQAYDLSGGALGSETLVNSRTTDFQQLARGDIYQNSNNFVTAWMDGMENSTSTHDGSGYGIYLQAFTTTFAIPPTAICQDLTVYLNGGGAATITAAGVDNGSSVASGSLNLSIDNSSFSCANLGANTVTLTVDDGTGNTSTCTSTVTVLDSVSPTAVCQDLTLYLDGTGNASVTAGDVDGGSSDNCGSVSGALSQISYSCADVGANSVVFTATDGSSNTSTCTAVITVEDSVSPVISCPANVIVGCTDATDVATLGNASATDNCAVSNISSADVTVGGSCPQNSSITRTFTATDAAGNNSNCTQLITIQDTDAPTMMCQAVTVHLDGSGAASVLAGDLDAGSTDDCGSVTLSLNASGVFACANIGSNNVALYGTDDCGNVDSCIATVTVVDSTSPTVTCRNTTVQLNNAGSATIVTTDVVNAFSDNCSANLPSFSPTSFTCSDIGANSVTVIVTDASGNATSCTATVNVEDNVAPSVFCQNQTVQLDAAGAASITAASVDSSSFDACGIASRTLDITTFSCANVGANTVTLTVTDVNGNSTNCTANITVEDNVAPTMACTDITIQLDGTGNASITAGDVDGGSSDACGISGLSVTPSAFTCANTGSNTVTLSATDVNGNTSNCTATVTVEDNSVPTALCQDITVQLDATGSATVAAADIDGGSSDVCGAVSLSISAANFTCTDLGGNTVTLTVTDQSNNAATCTAVITIQDNVAPTALCQDLTLQLDATGNVSTTAAAINNGSSDACGVASVSLSTTAFSCSEVGANIVTLTVTDVNSNVSTCIAVITVEDNIAPTAVCQDFTLQLDASGNGNVAASEIDNGSSDACGAVSLSVNPATFSCGDLGANTVSLTATDVNGNISNCTATVTVEDNVAPVAVCQDITVQLDATGNASINATNIDNGSSDACGITSSTLNTSTFTCNDVGANTVTLTVSDASGNTTTCTSVVTVQDNIAPTAVCQDITIQLDAAGAASITASDVDGGSGDGCGTVNLSVNTTAFACANVGANTVTLTATDVNSNTSTCSATVTVEDNVAPTAICQDLTIVLDIAGNGSTTAALVDNGSNDACGISGFSLSVSSFTCADVGANTVTLTATDVNGNASTCTATLTVIDNVNPVSVCQDITVQLDATGNATIATTDIDNGSSDACGISSSSLDITAFTCANVGANTVTLDVVDVNGLTDSCTATVTIQDNIAPTAVCQDITVQLDATGNASIVAADVDGGSSDACGINTLSVSPNSFVCTDVGANTVTLTVSDVNGNSATCAATVTIQDNVNPTAVCQDITVQLDATGNATITPADVDGGSGDGCGSVGLAVSSTAFTCTNVGANTVTLTATDVNGNSTACSAIVTIQDNVAPTAVCQDLTLQLDATGNASTTAAAVDNGSSDACGVASVTLSSTAFGCANVGTNSVTLTVTDVNSNVSTCTATLTVEDNVDPVAVCQDVTVQLDATGNAVTTTGDVDNGSSDICGIASSSLDVSAFTCANTGANTVTLTVVDLSGNSTACSATVTVEDNIAPTVVCQDITVDMVSTLTVSVSAADIVTSSSDNCGVISTSIPATSFDCDDIGSVNTVTATVTDASGNTGTCTANVTVADPNLFCNQPPVAVCQDITINTDANCEGTAVATDFDGGSSDPDLDPLTFSVSPAGPYALGTTTVTLTVTDPSGESDACTATVTVTDVTAPTAICQDVTVQLDAAGNASITPADVNNGSSDACGLLSLTVSPETFTCTNVGPNTATLTVMDVNGNTSTCTATISVEDNVDPVAVCQDVTVQLDAAGNGTLAASAVDNGSTDACGSLTLSVSTTSFTCVDVGPNTVTLTVTDLNGNTSSCTATATVEDAVAPVALCQDLTVQLDATGNGSITTADADNGSSDACGIDLLELNVDAYGCADVGTNANQLKATDVNGNMSLCNFTVTVEDNVAPVAVCQNLTVVLDSTGSLSIDAADVDNGSSDACGIASLTVNPSNVFCANQGVNTVTLTVTDVNGNVSTCTSVITVNDTEAPVAGCGNIDVYLDATGNTSIGSEELDDGSKDNCGIVSFLASDTTFTCADVPNVTVTLVIADGAGNLDSCTSIVTVHDQVPPVAICQDITLNLGSSGSVSVTAQDIDNGSTDNCGVQGISLTPTTFGCADQGANTVTLTVTDVNGNASTCTATVTITTDPLVATTTASTYNCGFNVSCNGATDGTATVNVIGGCLPYTYLWSDGQTSQTATGLAAGVYTVTTTDANGDATTATVALSEPAPVQVSFALTQVSCFDSTDGGIDASATGGCAPYTYNWSGPNGFTSTNEDLSGLAPGTYEVTVTDANGCSITGSTVVTEPDQVTATISCCADDFICEGDTTAITIDLSGTGPWVLTLSDGDTTFQVTATTASYDLLVSPEATTTYSLVSVQSAGSSCDGVVCGKATIGVNDCYDEICPSTSSSGSHSNSSSGSFDMDGRSSSSGSGSASGSGSGHNGNGGCANPVLVPSDCADMCFNTNMVNVTDLANGCKRVTLAVFCDPACYGNSGSGSASGSGSSDDNDDEWIAGRSSSSGSSSDDGSGSASGSGNNGSYFAVSIPCGSVSNITTSAGFSASIVSQDPASGFSGIVVEGLPKCRGGSGNSETLFLTYDICPDGNTCSDFVCSPLVAYSDGNCTQYEHAEDSTALFCNATATIDFDRDGDGVLLEAGALIDQEYLTQGITISAINNKNNHPDKAIIFDSNNPTGNDPDLGTPNVDFGGPGMGTGGRQGRVGENAVSLGNVLIIAENDRDNDNNGLVDNPDDEAKGGEIRIAFANPTDVHWVRLLDLDDGRGGSVMTCTLVNGATVSFPIPDLGNNSTAVVPVYAGAVSELKIVLGGSGALAEVAYCAQSASTPKLPPMAAEPATDNLQGFAEENRVIAYPNPFKEEINFELDLIRKADVRMVITDMNGRLIYSREAGNLEAGLHTLQWEGTDASGAKQSDGLYFARIYMDGQVQTVKIALQR